MEEWKIVLLKPNPPSSIGLAHGPLAQLVEQLTLNQRVRSSSLRRPTKLYVCDISNRFTSRNLCC